jgi:peptidylamidoglycolate lyase
MSDRDYLFPVRMNRRELLQSAAVGTGALLAGAWPARESRAAEKKPVRIGSGHWTYTLDEDWGRLPAGMTFGFGCAIVADSDDRIYVTSRTVSPSVAVFSRHGDLLETWGNDFSANVGYTAEQIAGTAHGLYCSRENGRDYFYFTENRGPNNTGSRVYKTDKHGCVLYTLGNVASEGSLSQRFNFVNPTDVAVAANGDIYIVDGYGSQLVHRFDKHFKLIRTMGGPGADHGKFNTCHGIWVSHYGSEPEIYIADRANNRLEVYSPELQYKRTIPEMRLPCCFYQREGHTYVPELGARVTILDEKDKIVARLGDGAGVKAEDLPRRPEVFATPHALTVDSEGDLYVIEWLPYGRPRRFKHTPA